MQEYETTSTQDTMTQGTSAIREKVSEVTDKAKDQVRTQLSSQKDRAADRLDNMTNALYQTGEQLQMEGQESVGRFVENAASQLDRWKTYLRDQDLDSMVNDLESLARRNPAVFVGGAFVLGLGVARFLKASRPETSYRTSSDWQSSARRGVESRESYRSSVGTASPTMSGSTAVGTAGIGTGAEYGTATGDRFTSERADNLDVDVDAEQDLETTYGTSRDNTV